MKDKRYFGILCAILAAAFYSLNSPLSKVLLNHVPATMMAGLLYIGAGAGLLCVNLAQKVTGRAPQEQRLSRKELPYTIGMIVLDIAAPICLMIGLSQSTAANASLLNNFEIVATSLIALLIFHERISPRLWLGIALVTLSSAILSVEDASSFTFSTGSLFVLLACLCWGMENNCTRMMSSKNPTEIVVIKGFFSGAGSILIALLCGEAFPDALSIAGALLLGFVAYGLSILFYIYAQRFLGAARTSAYYAIAPFLGVALSFAIFRTPPTASFVIALLIMLAGTIAVTRDSMES
ncbi:MAG: DMT family transporter [Clostridia bacterium]|nr:DMT family transporter [Clostridia bacterium]